MDHLTLIVLFVCVLFLIRHVYTVSNRPYKEFFENRKNMRQSLLPDWDAINKAKEIISQNKQKPRKQSGKVGI